MPLKTPEFWQRKTLLSLFLRPLSWFYQGISKIRWLGVTPTIVSCPVICVGNLTVGGAGKTPTVMALVDILLKQGHVPHILSRGYGGTLPGTTQVDLRKHTYKDVGDEPLLLARKAPTWVGKDRVASARQAIKAGATVLIMDDGYQNPALHKDVSFLVVNADYGFGNETVFPAGPLRESLKSGLQRCDGIILIGNKPISSQINLSSASVFRAAIKPRQSTPQDVIAFAGLGTPEKFKKTLEKEGYIVREFYAFSDHYSYAPQDIEKLLQRSYELKIPLLTTEKDFVRLPKDYQNHVQIFPIDLVFEDEEKITRLLQDLGK